MTMIVAVAITGVWWVTGYEALLLVVATQILQMMQQLTPLVRFDGYHVLADVTGVPDLFHRIKPTLLGALPWRWGDPEARLLKPWARGVITLWVVVVVPMLLLALVAMVLTLVATASCFGYVAALMQMPAKMTEFFVAISSNKYVLLMWLNIMLLVLGTALDLAPLLLICTPILLPVIQKFGIDPVHFGMILLVNSGIGLITPPVGPTLFVGCAIGKVTMEEVARELWPFYGAMCAALLLVTYVPAISLWLPHLLAR